MKRAAVVAALGVGSLGGLSQYDVDFGFDTVDPVLAQRTWEETLGAVAHERAQASKPQGDTCAQDLGACTSQSVRVRDRMRFHLDDVEVARPLGLGALTERVLVRHHPHFELSVQHGQRRSFGLKASKASPDSGVQAGVGVQGDADVVECGRAEISAGAIACYELEARRWLGTPAVSSTGRAVLWATDADRLDVSVDGFAIFPEGATLEGIRDRDWRDRFSRLLAPPMIDLGGDGEADAWRVVGRVRGTLAERRRPIDRAEAGWLTRRGDSNVTVWRWKVDGDAAWWRDSDDCWPSPSSMPKGRSIEQVLCRPWARAPN